tara:strand:- start:23428 stop:24465 length:1038 start_codon:yes stop_codon:yes gene_type:complete
MEDKRDVYTEPKLKVEAYTDSKGNKKEAVLTPFNIFAGFGKPTEKVGEDFDIIRYQGTGMGTNEYWKELPKSAPEAKDMIDKWKLPREIEIEAHTLSRELLMELSTKGGANTLRRQPKGRFDPKAITRVIKDLHDGSFSAEKTAPFKIRKREAGVRPEVVLVGDMATRLMWRDPQYIPSMARLVLSLSYACEAINCPMTATFAGALRKHGGYNAKYDALMCVLKDDDVNCYTNDFAVAFQGDMWRNALMSWAGSHEEHYQAVVGKTHRKNSSCGDWGVDSEVDAVAWARSRNPNAFVIAVGDIGDKDNADVQIRSGTDIKKAIKDVARYLRKHREEGKLEAVVIK